MPADEVNKRLPQVINSEEAIRLLPLDGEKGSVFCRVHGPLLSSTLPHFSPEGTLECASRTLLRMNNLTAVRGIQGEGMIGPADYYCNLERPDKYFYTIDIDQQGFPTIQHQGAQPDERIPAHLEALDAQYVTTVNATWLNGTTPSIENKATSQENHIISPAGDSLFKHPGILEIQDTSNIQLRAFDPIGIDLSSFKARLVKNDAPFQINSEQLPTADEYRAISYLYEKGYAQRQVQHGGGLFLEVHSFAQTITPLDQNTDGFVTLARWVDEDHSKLDMIAVKIPFGYTLIIDSQAIHGDANVEGMFLMCMTSNHVTMQTADTVFLKHADTKKNVMVSVDTMATSKEEHAAQSLNPPIMAPRPYVLYDDSPLQTIQAFNANTENMNFIFNPFSISYWKKTFYAIDAIELQTVAYALLATLVASTVCAITLGIGAPITIIAATAACINLGFFAFKGIKEISAQPAAIVEPGLALV